MVAPEEPLEMAEGLWLALSVCDSAGPEDETAVDPSDDASDLRAVLVPVESKELVRSTLGADEVTMTALGFGEIARATLSSHTRATRAS